MNKHVAFYVDAHFNYGGCGKARIYFSLKPNYPWDKPIGLHHYGQIKADK